MKFKRLIIAISTLAIIFGGIAASKALGWWKTTSSRNLGKGSGQSVSSTETHNESDAEEHGLVVSGTTTVGQALEMGIPEDILIEYVEDINNKDALLKDLIIANGLSFGNTKSVLNKYLVAE